MVKASFEPEYPPALWPPTSAEYDHKPYEDLAEMVILHAIADFLDFQVKSRHSIHRSPGVLQLVRREAESFLFGDSPGWRESRELWFYLAGRSPRPEKITALVHEYAANRDLLKKHLDHTTTGWSRKTEQE